MAVFLCGFSDVLIHGLTSRNTRASLPVVLCDVDASNADEIVFTKVMELKESDDREPIAICLADSLPQFDEPAQAVPIKLFELLFDNSIESGIRLASTQGIIESQNATIAQLTSELEQWRWWYNASCLQSASSDCADKSTSQTELASLRNDVDALAKRVNDSKSIWDSLPATLDKLSRSIAHSEQLLVEECDRMRKETLSDCSEAISKQTVSFQDQISNLATCMVASTEQLWRKTSKSCDAKLETQRKDLNNIRAALEEAMTKVDKTETVSGNFDNLQDRAPDIETCLFASHTYADSCRAETPEPRCSDYTVASPCDDACPALAFTLGDYVTLVDLKTTELNGTSGMVVSYSEESRRFGIKLTASGELKALKACNLTLYDGANSAKEICFKCGDAFYPNDFPPCGCPPSTSGATSDALPRHD